MTVRYCVVCNCERVYLPLSHEALDLRGRGTFMSSELVFHILVAHCSQIYRQESMQDENPLVQRADFGDMGRSRHEDRE